MLEKLITLRIVQWFLIHILEQKWVFVRKNDPRFLESFERHITNGDSETSATKITTVRSLWTLHALYRIEDAPGYAACDNVFGRRLACLGILMQPGQQFTLKVGNEPAKMFLLGLPGGERTRLVFEHYLQRGDPRLDDKTILHL